MAADSLKPATSSESELQASWDVTRVVGITCIVIWCIIVAFVAVRLGIRPLRNSVFPLFHDAGLNWRAGQNVYAEAGAFRYSPLVAGWFGLLSFLPMRVGQYLWMLVNLGGLAAGLYGWLNVALPRSPSALVRWAVALAATPMLVGSINNLQANPLMLGLLLLAVACVLKKRWNWAAAAIAGATLLKIYPLALGLVLLVQFPRQLWWRVLLFLALGLLLPFAMQHPSYVASSYHDWLSMLQQDGRIPVGSSDSRFMYADAAMLWFNWIGPVNPAIHRMVQLGVAVVIGLVALWARLWRIDTRARLVVLVGLTFSWMLLLGPSTESATYMLAAPLIAWLLVDTIFAKEWRATLVAAFFGYLLLLSSALTATLPGTREAKRMWGLQQLGVFMLLVALLVWLRQWKRQHPLPPPKDAPASRL